MKTRVKWKPNEVALVAAAYLEERALGKSKGDALRTAQERLPANRHKSLRLSGNVSPVLKLFDKLGLLRPKPASPQANKPDPAVAPAPAPPAPTDGIAASVRAVAMEVAGQVAAAVFEEIKSRLRALSAEFVRQESRQRPKVLVVGPISAQQNRLRSEVGELLDLRFVASDEPARRVREIAPTCSRVYLWTNYINHTHQEAAKSVAADRMQYVSGGVDTLKAALAEFAVQAT